jgi:hypothetical protein
MKTPPSAFKVVRSFRVGADKHTDSRYHPVMNRSEKVPAKTPAETTPKADSKSPISEQKNPEAKPELTPEEQMAQYEESLKETDWGHQPC